MFQSYAATQLQDNRITIHRSFDSQRHQSLALQLLEGSENADQQIFAELRHSAGTPFPVQEPTSFSAWCSHRFTPHRTGPGAVLIAPERWSDRVDCCEQLQSRLGNGETACSTTHHDSQFVLTNPYFDQDRITISDRKS